MSTTATSTTNSTTPRITLSCRMQRLVALGAVAAAFAFTPLVAVASITDDRTGHTTNEAAMRCWRGQC